MFARSQNALRGRWENLWASEQVCVVKLVDRDAVIDKLIYTAVNPVQDHLVDLVHHWSGVNGLAALLAGRPLRATRPLHFFRADGPMPNTVELRLTIPPGLGPEADVLAELRERVGMVEAERAAERERTGQRVCGRRAVLAQSWHGQPVSREPRRNLRPRVAAPNKWAPVIRSAVARAPTMDAPSAPMSLAPTKVSPAQRLSSSLRKRPSSGTS